MEINKKITILVNSCDAYNDVWPVFFKAIKNYWSEHVNIVLNSETIESVETERVVTHLLDCKEKNSTWGYRLRETLKNINTEYVLALYDDFIIEDYMDENELERIINEMDKNDDISVVYLTKINIPKIENSKLFTTPNKNKYIEIQDKVDFRLNSAPAIWRVSELLNYTGNIENPWAWEVFGTYKTFGNRKKFYCVGDDELDVYNYNYSKGGAIYRGKWVEEVVFEKNKQYNLDIDFSKRGFADPYKAEKRSIKWKVDFITMGYAMVGFKSWYFINNYLKRKFK